MNWIRTLIARGQAHLPNWPSWIVEGLAGIILQTLALLAIRDPLCRAAVTLTLSLGYEGFLDPHGWNRQDVLERLPGQVLVEMLRLLA